MIAIPIIVGTCLLLVCVGPFVGQYLIYRYDAREIALKSALNRKRREAEAYEKMLRDLEP